MKGVSDNSAQKKNQSQGNQTDLKRPLQVLQLNKKESKKKVPDNVSDTENLENKDKTFAEEGENVNESKSKTLEISPLDKKNAIAHQDKKIQDLYELEKPLIPKIGDDKNFSFERTVDDFDFDEDQFLAALNDNEPIGLTGETIGGKIIAIESDGVYIDIGGKAPGYMPKKECGLGVITNFKEKFPVGLEMEVLVIKEQNADGMVTVSARALILRKSWEKVNKVAKNGELINILVNGFNRGGLTCDVEGLRGFIPRSQLEDGTNYQSLVGKTLRVAFLEVNPESKKLVLSEKKATIVSKFEKLKLGQLIEGEVLAVKPYGFFINLGGASGLLHQSSLTKGNIRDLREVFVEGELVKALITEIDLERGRIGLDTALLENSPGELLIDKAKVMNEANERAIKAQSLFQGKD
tara:strand:+ start:2617 stop:3843 length:1227 start_codon:yes stop_codon:yes gene_type:complete